MYLCFSRKDDPLVDEEKLETQKLFSEMWVKNSVLKLHG
jgi:hypothetical protein